MRKTSHQQQAVLKRKLAMAAVSVVGLAGVDAPSALAVVQTSTWATTGTTVDWNLAANWSAGVPANTNILAFGADNPAGTAASHVLNNNIASLSVGGITFSAAAPAYTFSGNGITTTGNITNSSTNLQTINLNIAATAVRTVTMTAGGGDVRLAGNITGTAGGITATGTGTLTLSGTNSYDGDTRVNSTTATIVTAGTNTSAGSTTLTVGTLQLDNASNGGLASGTLTMGGGGFQSLLANQALSNAITVSSGSVANAVSGANSITLNGVTTFTANTRILGSSITGGNTLTLQGNVFLGNALAGGWTQTLAGTGNTTINGNIGDYVGGNATAGNSLTITNTGTTTLAGANTYTGTTTMNAATGTLVTSGTNNSTGGTTLTTGTLQLNNASNGGLASGTLTLTGTLQSLLANQAISNAVAMGTATVSGSNSITINGVTTFTSTGRTLTNSISSGALTLQGNVFLGNTVAGNFSQTLAGAGNTTINGNIGDYSGGNSSTGNAFKITNTGATTLNGANTFTGGLQLLALGGTVKLGNGAALGAGDVTMTSTAGFTLDLNGQTTTVVGGFNAATATNPIVLTNSSTTADAVLLLTGAVTSDYRASINDGSSHKTAITLNNPAAILKLGSTGTTVAVNNFSGGLNILAGTVKFGAKADSAGSSTNVITLGDTSGSNNATLASQIANVTAFPQPINVVAGNTGVATIGKVDSYSNAPTFSGAVTLGTGSTGHDLTLMGVILTGGITGKGNVTFAANPSDSRDTVTLSGAAINNIGTITNAGGCSTSSNTITAAIGANVTGITQNSAAAVLTLSGASPSYTGGITINTGTVKAGASANLGSGAVSISSTGVFDINGQSPVVGLLSSTSSTASVTNSGAAKVLTLNGTGTQTFAGVISATTLANLALTVSGGTQILSGNNTYAGATKVTGGTLRLASASALGGTSSISLATGGALQFGSGGPSSLAKDITVTSGTGIVSNDSGGLVTLSGTLHKSGTTLKLTGGQFHVGVIDGAAANSDMYYDNTVATVNAAGSYQGPTYVQNGSTLIFGVDQAIPTGSNLSITSGTAGSSTLNLSGHTNTIGTGTLTMNGASITGSGGLGAASLSASGNNSVAAGSAVTIVGLTTVDSGATLDVLGTLTSATMSVDPTATLSGTGTINAPVTVAGTGNISPAGLGTTGMLSSTSLTLGGKYIADLANAADADVLNVSGGNLNLTGSTLELHPIGTSGTVYVIAQYGGLTGAFSSSNIASVMPAGSSIDYHYGVGGHEIAVIVPEPATISLAVGIVAASLLQRKRRAALE